MRKHALLLATTLALSGALALPSAHASAATAKYADDFNGDGYRDLVVGAPDAIVGGKEQAGAVVVLYGSASGTVTTKKQLISQSTAGVPGAAEELDRFGQSVATADLDSDGYTDLLVAAPYEDVTGAKDRGSVTVLWGSASGLKTAALLSTPGPSSGGGGCTFGTGLAAANPKAVGAGAVVSVAGWCATRRLTGPFTRTGKAITSRLEMDTPSTEDTLIGDLNADGRPDYVDISVGLYDHPQGGVYINPTSRPLTAPLATDGDNAAIGDVNGDGYADLVVGDPADSVIDGTPQRGTGHKGGQIAVWLGSATGVDPARTPILLHQSTPGVPGAAESDDGFGSDVAVADVNGDGYGDIAAGVPGEQLGTKRNAGAVLLIPGGPKGPTGAGSRSITQDTAGVPGAVERGDLFGSTVRLIDINRNGRPELVVGAPGENNDTGGIWVLKGTSTGPTGTGSYSVMGTSVGLPSEHYTNWSSTQPN